MSVRLTDTIGCALMLIIYYIDTITNTLRVTMFGTYTSLCVLYAFCLRKII